MSVYVQNSVYAWSRRNFRLCYNYVHLKKWCLGVICKTFLGNTRAFNNRNKKKNQWHNLRHKDTSSSQTFLKYDYKRNVSQNWRVLHKTKENDGYYPGYYRRYLYPVRKSLCCISTFILTLSTITPDIASTLDLHIIFLKYKITFYRFDLNIIAVQFI